MPYISLEAIAKPRPPRVGSAPRADRISTDRRSLRAAKSLEWCGRGATALPGFAIASIVLKRIEDVMRVFLALTIFVLCNPLNAAPDLGDVWYVSTETLTLRKAPREDADSIVKLKFGDGITIQDRVKFAFPFSGDKKRFSPDLLPEWVLVTAGRNKGYLPITALASEWLFKFQENRTSTPVSNGVIAAKRGFSETEDKISLASMRGFSESENGDMIAMRGAMGSQSDVGEADPSAIDRIFQDKTEVADESTTRFIREGQLANSRTHLVLQKNEEQDGFFVGVLKSTRKFFAAFFNFASKVAKSVFRDNALINKAADAGELTSGFMYDEAGPMQEYMLGSSVAARILPLHPLLPFNHDVCAYVRDVGMALLTASNDPMTYRGYVFLVMRSDEVNAFAVPGGFVFVTTGMLKFLKDEDELAAILGHELAHLELRHGIKAVGKEDVFKFFALAKDVGVLVADSHGKNRAVVAGLSNLGDSIFAKMTDVIRNGYGVEMESQADWRSIQFSMALGYDSRALYDVLERFKSVKGNYGGASYPVERASDVLSYRHDFDCPDRDAPGRNVRSARYQAAVRGL